MACIDPERRFQDRDNWIWIRDAHKNRLVVGTQARILYQDAMGRMQIALKFNDMVRDGEIGPVMLGRDHHDTGGTDSPFRETANIRDGSNIMADMATHCFAGNAARGMSLVALHNGGGVGIGNAINGGFGLVLDGSARVDDGHPPRHPLGRHGRGGPPRLGAQRSIDRNLHRLQPATARPGASHPAVSRRGGSPGGAGRCGPRRAGMTPRVERRGRTAARPRPPAPAVSSGRRRPTATPGRRSRRLDGVFAGLRSGARG